MSWVILRFFISCLSIYDVVLLWLFICCHNRKIRNHGFFIAKIDYAMSGGMRVAYNRCGSLIMSIDGIKGLGTF